MRAACIVLAALLSAGLAVAEEGGSDPAGSIFVPGVDQAGSAGDLLVDMAAGAAQAEGLELEAAQTMGSAAAAAECAADDYACQASQTALDSIPASPDAPGRLDPLLREYVLNTDEAGPDANCAPAGERTRDPIWGTQSCRRDEDFANLDFAISASDTYVRTRRQGDELVITAGTVGDNYWRAAVYDRDIVFSLPGPEAFSSFVIEYISFDDWLLLEVNGVQVYNGPYHGDRFNINHRRHRVCYTAYRCGSWELSTSWNTRPNIDILPYLRRGTNRISSRVVVGGRGEFSLRLNAEYDRAYLEAGNRAATMQRCSDLRAAGCVHRDAGECLYARDGVCLVNAQRYDCPQSAPSSQIVSCPLPELCAGGDCAGPPGIDANSGDLAQAVALLEAGRQGSTYLDPDTLRMFQGTHAECRDKIAWGAQDCCRADGAGLNRTNAAFLAQLGLQAVLRSAPSAGSAYVYDTLFAGDLATSLNGLLGSLPAGAASSGSLFSYFGVEVSFSGSGAILSFDPASFAIAVAAAVIADLLSCNADEQLLGLRTGANLCLKYAEHCTSRSFFGGCRSEREYYCCYNSVLAKLVAEQGWAQLGNSYVQAGTCPGFSVEQFAVLAFRRIDRGVFIASVRPAAAAPRQSSYSADADAGLRESIRLNHPQVHVGEE